MSEQEQERPPEPDPSTEDPVESGALEDEPGEDREED